MTTLYGNPVPPDFNDGEELSADAFNAVKNYWVTDELPDTAEDGDVVFVVESDPFDPNATPGLPVLGGWATIKEVSGTYDKHTYNDADGDWVAYEFTDDSTLDISEGLVDMVLIGPGAGNRTTAPGGSGGQLIYGFHKLNSGSHQVTVEAYSSNARTQTKIEGPTNLYSGYANANSNHSLGKNRPSDDDLTAGKGAFFSYITGQKVYYGIAEDSTGSKPNNPEYPQSKGVRPNKGDGGGFGASSWNRPGSAGCLIIRVPKEYAEGVSETRHGWLNFATVENGVVTSVNKTPDNIPYTTAVDEIPCGPEVAEGWNYDGSEFVAPKPDYSEQIKELEETLKNLRSAK